jgi:hypothetical protein
MTAVSYPRHFAFLTLATVLLLADLPEPLPVWVNRLLFFPMLYGMLHAGALVSALNANGLWLKRGLFVALAAGLSGVVPYFGLFSTKLLGLSDSAAYFGAFALGSAGGAASYWFLIRFFWIPGLPLRSVAHTVLVCVAATSISLLLAVLLTGFGRSASSVADALPTIAWWLAFSLSLWFAEQRGHDR